MATKAKNKIRDIVSEFLNEQYHHPEDAVEIINDVVTFLAEQMYKFDPPQEVLDELEIKAASALGSIEDDIRSIIAQEW